MPTKPLRFLKANPYLLGRVAREMRPHELKECAAVGKRPLESLLEHKGRAWVALDRENNAVAACGCSEIWTANGPMHAPWLVGTARLWGSRENRRCMLEWAGPILAAWRKQHGALVNAVMRDGDEHGNYRWLYRRGARFMQDIPVNGETFVPYRI